MSSAGFVLKYSFLCLNPWPVVGMVMAAFTVIESALARAVTLRSYTVPETLKINRSPTLTSSNGSSAPVTPATVVLLAPEVVTAFGTSHQPWTSTPCSPLGPVGLILPYRAQPFTELLV